MFVRHLQLYFLNTEDLHVLLYGITALQCCSACSLCRSDFCKSPPLPDSRRTQHHQQLCPCLLDGFLRAVSRCHHLKLLEHLLPLPGAARRAQIRRYNVSYSSHRGDLHLRRMVPESHDNMRLSNSVLSDQLDQGLVLHQEARRPRNRRFMDQRLNHLASDQSSDLLGMANVAIQSGLVSRAHFNEF